ncbi:MULTISPECIES: hypothetical protein [unclassified Pseudovibrio]|uniref:hypothetical protein n=1 Tax=unclassified Pseudovibrio TaxID=2627060 RepID=UPI0007AE5715|nr:MULTISPECIES: hypothetical protein [unclassified Pseudovibrio]KZK98481.1 hypothetical protein PsW74_03069 [Pseudovibrio sp. W74]KZL08327.1 hypothetical protein PsAD14_03476 [Pseudovibrio sp. Ad14]
MADHSQPLETETHDSSWGKILLIAPAQNHVFDMLEPLTVLSDRLVAVRTSAQLIDELQGANVLPICILLPWQEDNPPELDELTQTIRQFRKGPGVEVPLLIITSGSAPVPLDLKPSATVSDAIPPDVLLPRIAGLRRLANRAEEARLRRGLFGPLPEYKIEFGPLKSAGLLVAGFGKHFGRTQALLDMPVEIVSGFSSDMTEDYLTARRFEAVLIDMPAWQACEEIERLRADPRYFNLPILAHSIDEESAHLLYSAGATDVLLGEVSDKALTGHIISALRAGRRQRLTDAILTVSSQWLARQDNDDFLSEQKYLNYLKLLEESTKRRGESIYELNLLELIERFTGSNPQAFAQHQMYWSGTVLSIAMAVCRDEDFVANIEGRGPVAVLRSKKGMEQLSNRVLVMVRTTGLGNG